MKAAWFSCDTTPGMTPGFDRIVEHAPDLVVSQGDTPYVAGAAGTLYGYTTGGAVATSSEADMLAMYRQYWAKPAAQRLLALRNNGTAVVWLPDDHEWTGDNWDHTITQANSPSGFGFTTQAEVNTHWHRANSAMATLLGESFDNPAYDAAGNTARPSAALTGGENPPTTNYPIKYFVRDYGTLCRVIFLDCLSYRSAVADTDNGSKRLLGAQQQAWLLARITEATAFNHIVVMSTKKLYGTAGGNENGDTAEKYTTERNTWLAAIQDTGRPVIWCSGDRHNPHVISASVAAGAAADIVDLCACPIGVDLNGVGRTCQSAGAQVDWIGSRHCYGLLTADATGLTAEIRSAQSGSVMYAARFAPGSNTPLYAQPNAMQRLP